jgi:hypothetical protein
MAAVASTMKRDDESHKFLFGEEVLSDKAQKDEMISGAQYILSIKN